MRRIRKIWDVGKSAVNGFIEDDALTLAAALSLYVAMSLAPLLLVAVWVLGFIFAGDFEAAAIEQAQTAVGAQAAGIIRTVFKNAYQTGGSTFAALFAAGTFIFFSSGVFAQLQYSLNRIWDVEPRESAGVRDWLRKRFWTLVMMVVIWLIFLISIAGSAVLSGLESQTQGVVGLVGLWWLLSHVVPLLIYVLLFAMIYKLLPDIEMPWSDVWFGATITTILFALGKWMIAAYLGRSSWTSVYGAAGSLMAMLIWLYYSSLIFFFGAELTQSIARARRQRIRPSRHAEWIDRKTAAAKTGQPSPPGPSREDHEQQ